MSELERRFHTKAEAEVYARQLTDAIREGICSHATNKCLYQVYRSTRIEGMEPRSPRWLIEKLTFERKCANAMPCPSTANGFGFCRHNGQGSTTADCYDVSRYA